LVDLSNFPNPFFRFGIVPNTAQSVTINSILEEASEDFDWEDSFKEQFISFTQAKTAISLNSCRAAIRLALEMLNLQRGDQVIIPSLCCGAVADAILSANCVPVLADVNPLNGTIDLGKLSQYVSERTRAIIPVHYQGLPCDMDEICEVSCKRNIAIIEDCAHSLGSKYKGEHVGRKGNFAVFSFGFDKPITTGFGGMLTSCDRESCELMNTVQPTVIKQTSKEQLRSLASVLENCLFRNCRSYGLATLSVLPAKFILSHLFTSHQSTEYRCLSRFSARIGLGQLRILKNTVENRRRNAAVLDSIIRKIPIVNSPSFGYTKSPVFLRYTILMPSELTRKKVTIEMKRTGIEAGPINWRIPLHEMSYYRSCSRLHGRYEGTSWFCSRFINLPCHQFMTESNFEQIDKVLKYIL
jgi:dTDP-4-amino-4,6-dideoxygalactose transaminase